MKNWARFLIGLGMFFVLLIAAIIALIILSPIIVGGGLLVVILIGLALVLFGIAMFFAFIWYLSREEPEEGKSTNYSIKQGKEK